MTGAAKVFGEKKRNQPHRLIEQKIVVNIADIEKLKQEIQEHWALLGDLKQEILSLRNRIVLLEERKCRRAKK